MIVTVCVYCGSTGSNDHGNTCEFCDGYGMVDVPEDDGASAADDEDA